MLTRLLSRLQELLVGIGDEDLELGDYGPNIVNLERKSKGIHDCRGGKSVLTQHSRGLPGRVPSTFRSNSV